MKFVFFGGNSQVAVETAAHLQRMGHSVLLYGRCSYPKQTLLALGLSYLQEPEMGEPLKNALAEADLAADFAFPAGEPWESVPQASARVERYLAHLPEHARFAAMSSISAYGMASKDCRLHWHRWPLTAYAAGKRQLEANATSLARRYARKLVAFRLGQVHGVLQSASQAFRVELAKPQPQINGLAAGASATVFADGVASALAFYAAGHLAPGIYPLLDQPQWPLSTLIDFYGQLAGSQNMHRVSYHDPEPPKLMAGLRSKAIDILKAHRGRIEPILFRAPALARFVKTRYRKIEAAAHFNGQSHPPMTCHYGDLARVLPLYQTPSCSQTLENWRWFEQHWLEKIEAQLR